MSTITHITSRVRGGGIGPGRVEKMLAFGQWKKMPWLKDNRSGSGRSGSVNIAVEGPGIYRFFGFAESSGRAYDGYFIIDDNGYTEISAAKFDELMAERYPAELAAAAAAEIARAEAAAADERRRNERLVELAQQAEQECAASIAKMVDAGLPKLAGSPKQIAWAEDLRAKLFARKPDAPQLREQTSAKWWIDNR